MKNKEKREYYIMDFTWIRKLKSSRKKGKEKKNEKKYPHPKCKDVENEKIKWMNVKEKEVK